MLIIFKIEITTITLFLLKIFHTHRDPDQTDMKSCINFQHRVDIKMSQRVTFKLTIPILCVSAQKKNFGPPPWQQYAPLF